MGDWLLIAATIWCACAGLVWLLALIDWLK
jgi:hypothetical protein